MCNHKDKALRDLIRLRKFLDDIKNEIEDRINDLIDELVTEDEIMFEQDGDWNLDLPQASEDDIEECFCGDPTCACKKVGC